MAEWKVHGRAGVAPNVATVAQRSDLAPNLFLGGTTPKYIEVMTAGATGTFTLEPRPGGSGNDIFVSPGALGLGDGASVECAIHLMSEDTFRQRKLLNTKSGLIALAGLFVALLGFLLDWTLKVLATENEPVIAWLAQHRTWLFSLAALLQIGGIGLAFWRTFRKGDY